MSIASEITRINNNIAAAYSACSNKGATLPQAQNSANLADTVDSIPTGTPVETLQYSQMNTQAGKYIAEVSYDPTDYTISRIESYVTGTGDHRPAGAAVTLPSAGMLTITDGIRAFAVQVNAGNYVIYNITPGSTGAYCLRNSSDNITAAGLLKPTGSLRMIKAAATDNIRDLGGWTCDGGTVRYGLLYRGGEIGAADAALFHDLLGIRAELNLRWDDEVTRDYSLVGDDVSFKHVNGPWYSVGDSANRPCAAHKQILDYVMDNVIVGKPVYFHCAAGADRTGTVAFLLEAILGMSQSDMDKDYELTCFCTGVGTDAQARRRNEDEWKSFMAQFASYSGNTMRDKVVNWAQTIGITIEKINAFRSAMIDGTPATLPSTVGTVSIVKNLTGVSGDNSVATNITYQPYEINLTPDNGKVIDSVQVTMGGTDITDAVFSGTKTLFRHSVSYLLSNCSVSTAPIRKAVVSDECFCCTIEADSGYTLEGATVLITMGGNNVSTYYQDGKVTIPKVTGNIIISVTAQESAPAYTNQIIESKAEIAGTAIYNSVGYKNGYRYNSSKAETAQSGMFTTGYVYVPAGATVRFYGDIISGSYSNANSSIYKTDGTYDYDFTPFVFYNHATTEPNARFGNYVYDDTAQSLRSFVWSADYPVWMKFTCIGSFAEGTTVITVNEEM